MYVHTKRLTHTYIYIYIIYINISKSILFLSILHTHTHTLSAAQMHALRRFIVPLLYGIPEARFSKIGRCLLWQIESASWHVSDALTSGTTKGYTMFVSHALATSMLMLHTIGCEVSLPEAMWRDCCLCGAETVSTLCKYCLTGPSIRELDI